MHMHIRLKNATKTLSIFIIARYNIQSKQKCCNSNKNTTINDDMNNINKVIIKDNRTNKTKKEINKKEEIIDDNIEDEEIDEYSTEDNEEDINEKDIENNNNDNIENLTNEHKNENIYNNHKNISDEDFRNDDLVNNENFKNNKNIVNKEINYISSNSNELRNDEIVFNEKEIKNKEVKNNEIKNNEVKIEIKNINEIKNGKDFKEYICSFFINPDIDIKDSEFDKFLKHYKSKKELLNPKLYHIIQKLFKQKVNSSKLLKLIEHKLNYENIKDLKYNKTVEYKDKTIFFIDDNNEKKYYKRYNDNNIEDKNLGKDIESIIKDIQRSVEFKYYNTILDNSPIKDYYISSLANVLVNLELNNKYKKNLYVQGMNLVGRFFLFISKNKNENNEIIFNTEKAYKLYHEFFKYTFNETSIKQLFNKTNFNLLDCYECMNNITEYTKILKNKIIKNLKLKEKEIAKIENNITCFGTMFPFDITITMRDYDNIKVLFLLLFTLDRYDILFDIYSLYLLKFLEDEKITDDTKKKIKEFNVVDEIL